VVVVYTRLFLKLEPQVIMQEGKEILIHQVASCREVLAVAAFPPVPIFTRAGAVVLTFSLVCTNHKTLPKTHKLSLGRGRVGNKLQVVTRSTGARAAPT
jgi:hypothetical protein